MKFINKYLGVFVGVVYLCMIPTMVDAKVSLGFEDASEISSERTVPVYIYNDEGDTLESVTIGCKTGNSDVKCVVKATNADNWSNLENSNGSVYFANTKPEEALAGTKIHIADIVLTNEISAMQNITLAFNNTKIGNEDVTPDSTSISLRGKEQDPVKSSDATLKSVKFSQGTWDKAFNKDVTSYTIYGIADTVNSITLSDYSCDNCGLEIDGGKSVSGSKILLNNGENKVLLKVTSQDGDNKSTYTFNIIKGKTGFNSAKLDSLSFDKYTLEPEFSADVNEYTLSVPNEITNLNNFIKYNTADSEAKVEITGLDNFQVGSNVLIIKVTNRSEEETITYTITVNRATPGGIEITKYLDGEVSFKDSLGEVHVMKEAEFKAKYPNDYKLISDGTLKFDEDGNVLLEMPKEDKEDEDQKEDKKVNKTALIIILVAVGIIIITISGVFIFKDDKKKSAAKKDADTKEEKTEVSPVEEEVFEKEVTSNTEETNKEVEDVPKTYEEDTPIGETFSDDMDKTVDIDIALNDLMSTKQYDFNFGNDEDDK